MAYLTHIIDHYDKLADVVLFHHSHRKSWHQELDSLTEVRSLRPSYVARKGYASTRCLPGCENVIPLADFAADFSLFPRIGRDVQLASLLHEFMDNDRRANQGVDDDAFLSGITKLAAPCCSQFAASRHAIRARSREWWMRLRQWLIDTPLDNRTAAACSSTPGTYGWARSRSSECPVYSHAFFLTCFKLADWGLLFSCPKKQACKCHMFGMGDNCEQYYKEEESMYNNILLY